MHGFAHVHNGSVADIKCALKYVVKEQIPDVRSLDDDFVGDGNGRVVGAVGIVRAAVGDLLLIRKDEQDDTGKRQKNQRPHNDFASFFHAVALLFTAVARVFPCRELRKWHEWPLHA